MASALTRAAPRARAQERQGSRVPRPGSVALGGTTSTGAGLWRSASSAATPPMRRRPPGIPRRAAQGPQSSCATRTRSPEPSAGASDQATTTPPSGREASTEGAPTTGHSVPSVAVVTTAPPRS